MSYAYAVTNLCSSLAAGAFVFSAGLADATRTRLNDARMDKRYVNGSPVTSISMTIDLGSALASTGVAVLNSNVAAGGLAPTLLVRAGTAAASGVVTAGIVTAKAATTLTTAAPYNKDHVLQYTSITKQFIELTWTYVGTATSFSIGELWVFNAQTVLSRKSIYGGGEDEEIKSADVEFYNGGTRSSFLGGPIRSLVLPFADLSLAERKEQATMWRATRGKVTPFLFIDSYEATAVAAAAAEQQVLYGKMQKGVFSWKEPDYQLFNPDDLVIRSLSREAGA